MSLKVKEALHAERSEFQDIVVFQSTNHGRVLALDGVLQLTEWDEFSYQEMITHVPLFAHAAPRSVLIVGAGDGGVLREVCRHRGVQSIVMVEIDRQVRGGGGVRGRRKRRRSAGGRRGRCPKIALFSSRCAPPAPRRSSRSPRPSSPRPWPPTLRTRA